MGVGLLAFYEEPDFMPPRRRLDLATGAAASKGANRRRKQVCIIRRVETVCISHISHPRLSSLANDDQNDPCLPKSLLTGFEEVYPLWALATVEYGGLGWDTIQIGKVTC